MKTSALLHEKMYKMHSKIDENYSKIYAKSTIKLSKIATKIISI